MATKTHGSTVWAFDTLTTNLATNTTLGTSPRHDFTAITVFVTESSPSFLSAEVEVGFRSVFPTTARNVTGVRIGIKLGAVAFSDQDYTPTVASSTSASYAFQAKRDVTSYFNTNWSGTSMSCQVGIAVSMAAAENITNVWANLILTYSYDDNAGVGTYIKTVRIPIQSMSTTLTTSQQEVGVDGANPAPANQIPLLDDFLPEDGVVIRQAFIQILGNDGRNSTTDFNLQVQIDSGAVSNRATIESALSGSCIYKDNLIYDTGTYLTSAAHAFKCASSLTATFPCIGAVLYVTYEYDAESATILNSILFPIDGQQSGSFLPGTVTADAIKFDPGIWVEEPGTITLVQSGIVLEMLIPGSTALSTVLWGGGQAERTYAWPSLVNYAGQAFVVHRTDHGTSPWSLTRGLNELLFQAYTTVSNTRGRLFAGYVIVNYTSSRASAGPGSHNVTCAFSRFDYPTSGGVAGPRLVATATQRFPDFSSSTWLMSALGVQSFNWIGLFNATYDFQEQVLSTELSGESWLVSQRVWLLPSPALACYENTLDYTNATNASFNVSSLETGGMDPEAPRTTQQFWGTLGGANLWNAARWWVTFSTIEFEVSAAVSGYPSGDGSGITVELWSETRGVRVASTVTTIGGNYTISGLVDSADTYFAEAYVDSTHVGRSDNITPTEV